jgi:hypothetical protein
MSRVRAVDQVLLLGDQQDTILAVVMSYRDEQQLPRATGLDDLVEDLRFMSPRMSNGAGDQSVT